MWINDGAGGFDAMDGGVVARSDDSGEVVLEDFDSDGFVDIFIKTSAGQPNELFYNDAVPGFVWVTPGGASPSRVAVSNVRVDAFGPAHAHDGFLGEHALERSLS